MIRLVPPGIPLYTKAAVENGKPQFVCSLETNGQSCPHHYNGRKYWHIAEVSNRHLIRSFGSSSRVSYASHPRRAETSSRNLAVLIQAHDFWRQGGALLSPYNHFTLIAPRSTAYVRLPTFIVDLCDVVHKVATRASKRALRKSCPSRTERTVRTAAFWASSGFDRRGRA